MFDFFLVYPFAFVIGFAASIVAISKSSLKIFGLSLVFGALTGGGVFLAYHSVLDGLPSDFPRALLSTVFWAAAFALIGAGVVVAFRWFIRLLRENL